MRQKPYSENDRGADEKRRAILALLPALMLGAEANAQDAAQGQPGAYRVALENDRIRVLDFRSRPGLAVCGIGMHSHPAHLTVVLTPAKARAKLPDGKVITRERKAGDVFWSEAVTHEVENISGSDIRALLIEMKSS